MIVIHPERAAIVGVVWAVLVAGLTALAVLVVRLGVTAAPIMPLGAVGVAIGFAAAGVMILEATKFGLMHSLIDIEDDEATFGLSTYGALVRSMRLLSVTVVTAPLALLVTGVTTGGTIGRDIVYITALTGGVIVTFGWSALVMRHFLLVVRAAGEELSGIVFFMPTFGGPRIAGMILPGGRGKDPRIVRKWFLHADGTKMNWMTEGWWIGRPAQLVALKWSLPKRSWPTLEKETYTAAVAPRPKGAWRPIIVAGTRVEET